MWFAWNTKEVVRQNPDCSDAALADAWVAEIGRDFADPEMPIEVCWLGRTIARWADEICAWHRSHVSNGPTGAAHNLAKRTKPVAFGLVKSRHHGVRCLIYAGRTDRTLLPTIRPSNTEYPQRVACGHHWRDKRTTTPSLNRPSLWCSETYLTRTGGRAAPTSEWQA